MHFKQAYACPEYRKIRELARPYYKDTGPNSWEHIQAVRRRAAKMMRKLQHRSLTPEEYAAVLMHDSTKLDLGGENHGRSGAERAAKVLAVALAKKDLDKATEAIAVHDDNLAKFPSQTAELLASADANPPDVDWQLNKGYSYWKRKGADGEEAMANALRGNIKRYGPEGTFNWPGIYKEYYGDRVPEYQKTIANMTVAEMRDRLKAYHEKYNIDPNNPRVIQNI